MSALPDSAHVTVGPIHVGVVVVLGATRVSVVMPVPSGVARRGEVRGRAAALRNARSPPGVAEEKLQAAETVA